MIGLSLAGGGVKGSYEVGAYFALKKCHIKIDGFVGTSIGSFNAAMLCAGMEYELLKFWQSVDVGEVLNFDKSFTDILLNKKKSIKDIKDLLSYVKDIVKNKGVSTDGLKKIVESYNLEPSIRKSNKDFGLVTVKFNKIKPLYLFKEDIEQGKLNDYILGSCYFPIFKQEKMIDNSYYIDGGFYDNSPANMLLDKGYDKVYIIDLEAVGFKQKIKDKSRVVIIKPSKPIGGVFNLDSKRINYNIKLGYFDTLKVLKNLDGKKYIFKKKGNWFYKRLIRKVKSRKLKEMQLFFKTKDTKELIISALEYIMKKEQYEYTCIYNPLKVIKEVKKNKKNPIGVYKFICELSFF